MAFVAEQAWQAFASGGGATANFGQATVADNLLITFLVKDDDVFPTTISAGWTRQHEFVSGTAIAMGCYIKIADGTETEFAVTGDSEVYSMYGIELSGADPLTPILNNSSQQTGTSDLAAISISALTSFSIETFYMVQIGVDRNRTFTGWTNGTGIEPAEYWRREGAGSGDVSQLVMGITYSPAAPAVTRFMGLSAADEWGSRGLYITAPLSLPTISLPTGTGNTQSAVASNITGAGFTTDVDQGEGYWYLSSSATQPSTGVIRSGSGSIQNGQIGISAAGIVTFGTISSLSPNTQYYLHYFHRNAIKESNVVTASVLTPPFELSLVFDYILDIRYTGARLYFYTSYQNTGTAYCSMTASATPPSAADIIANTVPGGLMRTTDTSWSTSSNPNILFNLYNTAGADVIFPNTQYYAHAVVDDPGAGAQSAVVTVPFITRERFVVSNFVATESLIDQISFEYDLTLNESLTPRVYVYLFEDDTPRNGDEMYNQRGTAAWYQAYLSPAAADGTYSFIATGLAPLTTYYLHVAWYDASWSDTNNDVYYPVLSPAMAAPTALDVEYLTLSTTRALIINDPLEYAFVRFGVPGRNVTGQTEYLTLTTSPATADQGRDVIGVTEQLEWDVFAASVVTGAGDALIIGITEVLELTVNSGTVGQGQTAFGTTEQLTLTVNPAIVRQDVVIVGTTEQLTLTVNTGVVLKERVVNTVTEQLTLTATPGTVGQGMTVRGITELLELTVNPGDVQADREVNAPTELLELTTAPSKVGQGQTAKGVTEQLTLTGIPGQIIRDRLVEAHVAVQLIIVHGQGRVGRGDDIDGLIERLVLKANKATIKRGRRIDGGTEQLVLTGTPAKVGRGVTFSTETEQLVLTANPATIRKSLDRHVSSFTHSLVLTTQTALVDQGRSVISSVEQLVLSANPADVDQVLRPTGVLLAFYGQEGVEIIKSPRQVAVLKPVLDGVTVETPGMLKTPRCGYVSD